MNNMYRIIGRFECCGKVMVAVQMETKAACIMTEKEYNNIIKIERKNYKSNVA